jgi:hypothetical protein
MKRVTGFRLLVALLVVAGTVTAGSASFGTQGAASNAPAPAGAAAAPRVRRYPPGTPGIVNPVPPGSPAGTAAAAAKGRLGPLRARRAVTHSAQAAPAALSVPVAAAAPGTGSSTLQRSIVGVSSLDSAVTNFGLEFEPPDQGLCVGNGFVLEPVNSAYRIYGTNGRELAGPFNVNDLFNEGRAEYTSDPRCYFDVTTNTWFATILFISSDNLESHLDIAVNNTGDPRTPWVQYRVDTTELHQPGHAGCPCFGDQPLLGIDQSNVYVSTAEFSIVGPEANGAQIYAFTKADLVASHPTHFVHFENLGIGGDLAFTVQPALSTGTAAAEYFLSSLDPNFSLDNRIGVWAMTHQDAVATGQSPVLTSTVIRSETYGVPPGAEQQGSASRIDSGDDRMQQVQFIGGDIWGALGTALTTPGDPVVRAGAAWFRIHPAVTGDSLSAVAVVRQSYVASSGSYVIYPAIGADAAGHAAMVFTLTGTRLYPSADYAVLSSGQSEFGPLREAAHGTGPYDMQAGRWGDYSFAVVDPVTGSFWMATEYMPPRSVQTVDRARNWGTRVAVVAVH